MSSNPGTALYDSNTVVPNPNAGRDLVQRSLRPQTALYDSNTIVPNSNAGRDLDDSIQEQQDTLSRRPSRPETALYDSNTVVPNPNAGRSLVQDQRTSSKRSSHPRTALYDSNTVAPNLSAGRDLDDVTREQQNTPPASASPSSRANESGNRQSRQRGSSQASSTVSSSAPDSDGSGRRTGSSSGRSGGRPSSSNRQSSQDAQPSQAQQTAMPGMFPMNSDVRQDGSGGASHLSAPRISRSISSSSGSQAPDSRPSRQQTQRAGGTRPSTIQEEDDNSSTPPSPRQQRPSPSRSQQGGSAEEPSSVRRSTSSTQRPENGARRSPNNGTNANSMGGSNRATAGGSMGAVNQSDGASMSVSSRQPSGSNSSSSTMAPSRPSWDSSKFFGPLPRNDPDPSVHLDHGLVIPSGLSNGNCPLNPRIPSPERPRVPYKFTRGQWAPPDWPLAKLPDPWDPPPKDCKWTTRLSPLKAPYNLWPNPDIVPGLPKYDAVPVRPNPGHGGRPYNFEEYANGRRPPRIADKERGWGRGQRMQCACGYSTASHDDLTCPVNRHRRWVKKYFDCSTGKTVLRVTGGGIGYGRGY